MTTQPVGNERPLVHNWRVARLTRLGIPGRWPRSAPACGEKIQWIGTSGSLAHGEKLADTCSVAVCVTTPPDPPRRELLRPGLQQRL